jgi:hypothetical protein
MRTKAMKWWNDLPSLQKTQLCDTNTELLGSPRRWETLTGSEIEKLYKMMLIANINWGKENFNDLSDDHKANFLSLLDAPFLNNDNIDIITKSYKYLLYILEERGSDKLYLYV